MTLDKRARLFLVLCGVFVTCLVVGDIIGGKLVQLGVGRASVVISVGMIPFPITFLLTDILNEFYGKRAARFVTIVGFFMAVLASLTIFVAQKLPWAPLTREAGYVGMVQPSFDNVFGGSQRILVASMCAYLVSQFLDIAVFHALKRLTGTRFLWLRATGSTVVSQLVDTIVIQFVAWSGVLSFERIVSLAVTSYVVKLVVAIGLTPLIYAGHVLVERALGIEPMKIEDEPDGALLPATTD